MKQLTFLLGLLIILVSASCTKEKTIVLKGTITNAESSELFLNNYLTDNTDTLVITDGQFSIETGIANEQYLYLNVGQVQLPIYAEPGKTINISINEAELKARNLSNVTIEGSEATALLNEIEKSRTTFYNDFKSSLALSPAIFEAKVEQLKNNEQTIIDSIAATTILSKIFREKYDLTREIGLAGIYGIYNNYHKRFAPNDTSKIPEYFTTYGNDIPLDNYNYFKEISLYKNYVINSVSEKISNILVTKELAPRSKAYLETEISEINAYNTFTEVKNALGSRLLDAYARMPDSIKTVLESRYKDIVTDEKIIEDFNAKIAKINQLIEGKPAPSFSYPDIEGNIVNSADLKGKVIYIDVWATWCGPCKAEIPHLKGLEKELHDKDIAFVSISVDNDKSAWEKMVTEEALKGYQLFAEGAWESDIIKDYLIRGIPRFIMIDKSGNIINVNATRPSNPETKETLLKYADM